MLAKKTQCSKIVDNLKLVKELLDSEQHEEILNNIDSLADYVSNPNCIVSVFGSFNRGKSTLLNALLGQKLLPTDLIPTTGATIKIKHGAELKTRIILNTGEEIIEKGTEALNSFTRLNSERQMRSDISSVEVFVPNFLLENGIELVDLPGTNDREEQDRLVRNQLFSADLVINVLDASQLFTLTEAENLQDWLIEREIKSVIFVVNFLNLLEEDDQKLVMQRACSLAEEFRGDLPDGISNLYRVDALPALKAKRKGDKKAVSDSGILNFESALQNVANLTLNDYDTYRLPRVKAIYSQVKQSLETQVQVLKEDLKVISDEHNDRIQKLSKQKLSCQDFGDNFTEWISSDSWFNNCHSSLMKALKDDEFGSWKKKIYQSLNIHLEPFKKCIEKTCDISQQSTAKSLFISLPSKPFINTPKAPEIQDERTKRSVAIATGVGWFVLGPVGGAIAAGATHYANEKHKTVQQELWDQYNSNLFTVYSDEARKYLEKTRNTSLMQISQYIKEIEHIFRLSDTKKSAKVIAKEDKLNKLTYILMDL